MIPISTKFRISRLGDSMRHILTKSKGFTLTEMIFVMAIIGILSFSINMNWLGSDISLVTQASQLASDIRLAQAMSMSRNQRYRFVITSGNSYRVLDAAGTPIKFGLGNTTVTLSGTITFGGLTNLPNNLIAFDALGTPYTNTSLPGTPLAGNAVIPITQGGKSKSIIIIPNTGKVSIQ